jgi:hypothetical protein
MKSGDQRVGSKMADAATRTGSIFALIVGLYLAGPVDAIAMPIPSKNTPLVDSTGVLSVEVKAKITGSISSFRTLTGREMAVIVIPGGTVPDYSVAERKKLDPAIGIIYVTSPDDAAGRLVIVDPVWRKAAPTQWTYMFPQRLAQKYGNERFEQRLVLSADYLARVFADKIAFVLKPRGGTLTPESLRFSRGAFIGIELLGYFIIFFNRLSHFMARPVA